MKNNEGLSLFRTKINIFNSIFHKLFKDPLICRKLLEFYTNELQLKDKITRTVALPYTKNKQLEIKKIIPPFMTQKNKIPRNKRNQRGRRLIH